jgi:amidase
VKHPLLFCALSMAVIAAGAAEAAPYSVEEKSIGQLKADLAAGRVTSVELVRLYEQRIARLNPRLHAVIALNPDAPAQAAASDAARKAKAPLGPLAGVPILLKDNIETADKIATTAGSLALARNVTGRDAPLVHRLRAAGAIILGKTNLSEWANIRSGSSISGWSGVGGQTRNPYALDRNACGSSSGSGSAAAASLAAAAVGTETDGSVTCPSAINGLVGLKPTVGLISRTRVVPISHTQDTPGPMARDVRDAALLLEAMAGSDPEDPATAHADAVSHDYLSGLKPGALSGVRVGVLRFAAGMPPETAAVFDRALQGLKADLNAYLASTSPAQVPTRTLAEVIAFDKAHAAQEMSLFGQDLFEEAEKTPGLKDPAYLKAKADAHRLAGPEGIDRMLSENHVSVLVAPTMAPAWLIDPVLKDAGVFGEAGGPPAIAGYPHLTVPMGQVRGLPVGLSLIGPAWSEASLLAYGYAFEQAAHARKPPRYLASSVGEEPKVAPQKPHPR